MSNSNEANPEENVSRGWVKQKYVENSYQSACISLSKVV